jgi:cholesterol transport system auxiliary component
VAQTTVETTAIALDSSNAARAKALTDAGRACVSELAAVIVDTTDKEGVSAAAPVP